MPDYVVAITTADSAASASELAKAIVNARLAACVQVNGPVSSVYRWEGDLQEDQEWQLWIKTTSSRVDGLITFIKANHRYEIPEVIVLPVIKGSPEYLNWITEETDSAIQQ